MNTRAHASERRHSPRLLPMIDRRRTLWVAPAVGLVVLLLVFVGQNRPDEPASTSAVLARIIEVPKSALSKERLARAAGSFVGGPTTASTGETVNIYVSSSLSPELGTPQTWADFIAGLAHAQEISALTAYIASVEEMQALCGEGALGCYTSNRMVAMGTTTLGVTAAEVVRHEYGHHLALNRLNPPWQAIDWGPKHWASVVNVCRRAADGTAFPGDEGKNYALNPGEAWAETYRVLNERRSGAPEGSWEIVSPAFYPDDGALAAAQRDITEPWTAPKTSVLRKRFTRMTKNTWTTRFETPRDGTVQLRVSLPNGGLHGVVLLDGRKPLATGLWSSAREKKISTTVCGQRSLLLRVTRKGALGLVEIAVSIP